MQHKISIDTNIQSGSVYRSLYESKHFAKTNFVLEKNKFKFLVGSARATQNNQILKAGIQRI
jgi:hypothetical protein